MQRGNIPSSWVWTSFEQAAALPCAGFTAYQALYRKLHVQPGQTVLGVGGAGGVGGFAVQLAASSGCVVIATCSSRNLDYVRGLGATYVVDYTTESLTERVRTLTDGRGVDAVLDTVSSASATEAASLLACTAQAAGPWLSIRRLGGGVRSPSAASSGG